MKLSKILFPPPFQARHYKRTFIASPDDEAAHASPALIETALACARKTLEVDVSDICGRVTRRDWDPGLWPGEHYRLLAGLAAHLRPETVVEIGTETGLSALCLLKYLPPHGSLTTFDLVPWQEIDGTYLVPGDFADGRLRQELIDLAVPEAFAQHAALFAQADFIFVDGPKDGRFEPALAARLDTVEFTRPPYVLFDDIRDLNMLRFWRELRKPKLDISSFGHWTGTGLVRWEPAC